MSQQKQKRRLAIYQAADEQLKQLSAKTS